MTNPADAPTPDPVLKRRLAACGNRLPARLHVGRDGVTEGVVEEARRLFAKTDLIKVRVEAHRGADVDATAGELARRVPCALIKRVGKIALLYRPLPAGEEGA